MIPNFKTSKSLLYQNNIKKPRYYQFKNKVKYDLNCMKLKKNSIVYIKNISSNKLKLKQF